jgi:D-glycero-D-manno-heptose 1,7-bisphosphate phosphatase
MVFGVAFGMGFDVACRTLRRCFLPLHRVADGPLQSGMHAAVFLDRDDTLIEANSLPAPSPPANPGDVVDPASVRLLAGVREACMTLRRAGLRLIVYSNQGGVARGAIDLRTVEAINDRVRGLAGAGVFDAFYVCPFHPRGNRPEFTREHGWRKPAGGMIRAAAAELSIDLTRSWAVGDAARDVEAGVDAGIAPERCVRLEAGTSIPDLRAAAEMIAARIGAASGSGSSRGAGVTRDEGAARGSTVRLRALDGTPMRDAKVRATVMSTAAAIAERTGIALLAIEADDRSVTVTIDADRIAGLGFLAEVRRLTGAWYAGKHGGASLWGEGDRE